MDPYRRYTLTEFLRGSGPVLSEAEQGYDVLIRRRDGPDMVLRLASREEGLRRILKTAAGLIAVVMRNPIAREQILRDSVEALPWLAPLPPDDQVRFIQEFARQLAAAVDTGDVTPLLKLRESWQSQADLHNYPDLAQRLTGPVNIEEEYVQQGLEVTMNRKQAVPS